MRQPTQSEKATAYVLLGWLLALIFMSWLLTGCQHQAGGAKPSTFDALTTAESTITAGANTLHRALALGTITPDDPDYAKAYNGLHEAGAIMDRAWAAYRAGELGTADASRRLAMESYILVRPIIIRLSENQ